MKKMIIVIITGIAVFIIVTLLMNKCTSALRESIENETTKQVVENNKKYDINTPFSEYNLNGFYEWLDYVNYIKNNFIDEKIVKCIGKLYDVDVIRYYDRWDKREYTGLSVRADIIARAQNYVLKLVLQPDGNWTDLPITENFRNKFDEKDGVLKYYNLSNDVLKNEEMVYVGNGIIKFNITDKNYIQKVNHIIYGKNYDINTVSLVDSIESVFCVIFDDRDYIDNIYYLGETYHYETDAETKNIFSLDNVEDIKNCIYELCISEEYLLKGNYELSDITCHGMNMYYYTIDNNYRDKVFHSNGILPIKDYLKDSLEVISYDENTKEAKAKIETEDKKIFYKIKLDIDEDYWLNNATVELDREEDK